MPYHNFITGLRVGMDHKCFKYEISDRKQEFVYSRMEADEVCQERETSIDAKNVFAYWSAKL